MKNALTSLATLAGIGLAIALPLYVALKYDTKQRAEQEDAQLKKEAMHKDIVNMTFDNPDLSAEGKSETYTALSRIATDIVSPRPNPDSQVTYDLIMTSLGSHDTEKIAAAYGICKKANEAYDATVKTANTISVNNASFKSLERIVSLVTTAFSPSYYTNKLATKIVENC